MSLEIGLRRTPWVPSCACSPCVSRPGRSRVASTGWRGPRGKKSNLPQLQPRGELRGRTASPSQTFRTCGPCQRLGCHLTKGEADPPGQAAPGLLTPTDCVSS